MKWQKMGNHVLNTPSPNRTIVAGIGSLVTNGPPEESGIVNGLLGDAFGNAVRGGAIRAIDKAIGPASIVIDYIIDWSKKKLQENAGQQHYVAGIRALAEKGAPGFFFQTMQVNGQTVQIAVDASGKLLNSKTEPFIWIDADDADAPQVKELIAAARKKTDSEIEEFKQESLVNLPERKKAYLDELKDYTASIGEAEEEGVDIKAPPSPHYGVADDYQNTIRAAHDSIAEDVRLSMSKKPQEPQVIQAPALTP
jgi:hypothetical protein